MVCLPTCLHQTRNATHGSTHGAATMNPGSAVRLYNSLYITIVKSCVLALVTVAFKLSTHMRTRIELLQKGGLHAAGIFRVLKHEGSSISFPSVVHIVKKLQTTGRPVQLSYKERGWMLRWTTYCPLIQDPNKVKRLEFAWHVLESEDTLQHDFQQWACLLSSTGELAIGKSMSRQSESWSQRICWRFMCGQGLVDMVPQEFASLMETWMLLSTATSWRLRSSHSLERSCLFTGSCWIMTWGK